MSKVGEYFRELEEMGFEDQLEPECEHEQTEYIPPEPDVNVAEDLICRDCGKSLEIYEGDEYEPSLNRDKS